MACVFCNKNCHDNIIGELCQLSQLRFHSGCLLYSGDIVRHRNSLKGLFGYKIENIESALERAQDRSCIFCEKNGATVKCSETDCEATFHLPCALNSKRTLHLLGNEYRSYCPKHIPDYKCIFDWEPITGINMSTRCCNQVYSHTECFKKHATIAKTESLRCPICSNVDNFKTYISNDLELTIPKGTASYSRPENTAYDLQCTADICRCTLEDGRFAHVETTEFDLISCTGCGSDAIHRICGQSEIRQNNEWICEACNINVDEPRQPVNKLTLKNGGKRKRKSKNLRPIKKRAGSKDDRPSFGLRFQIIFPPKILTQSNNKTKISDTTKVNSPHG